MTTVTAWWNRRSRRATAVVCSAGGGALERPGAMRRLGCATRRRRSRTRRSHSGGRPPHARSACRSQPGPPRGRGRSPPTAPPNRGPVARGLRDASTSGRSLHRRFDLGRQIDRRLVRDSYGPHRWRWSLMSWMRRIGCRLEHKPSCPTHPRWRSNPSSTRSSPNANSTSSSHAPRTPSWLAAAAIGATFG